MDLAFLQQDGVYFTDLSKKVSELFNPLHRLLCASTIILDKQTMHVIVLLDLLITYQ